MSTALTLIASGCRGPPIAQRIFARRQILHTSHATQTLFGTSAAAPERPSMRRLYPVVRISARLARAQSRRWPTIQIARINASCRPLMAICQRHARRVARSPGLSGHADDPDVRARGEPWQTLCRVDPARKGHRPPCGEPAHHHADLAAPRDFASHSRGARRTP